MKAVKKSPRITPKPKAPVAKKVKAVKKVAPKPIAKPIIAPTPALKPITTINKPTPVATPRVNLSMGMMSTPTPTPKPKVEELKSSACCSSQGNFGRIFFGLLLVLFGLLYLAKNFGLLPFEFNMKVWEFWPLLVIIIGASMLNKKSMLSILVGTLGAVVFVGIVFFIVNFADMKYSYDEEFNMPVMRRIEKTKTPAKTNQETSSIKINNITPNQLISNPLVINGEARGKWFFEGSFPVKLIASNGEELALGIAQAEGEWMTTDFVKFSAELNFKTSTSSRGLLIFERDNPSGLEQNSERYMIPVNLK